MFVNYEITAPEVNPSFFKGISLIIVLTLFVFSILGTVVVSIIIVDLFFAGIVFANNVKVEERNDYLVFSELKTISSPKELLSFVDVPLSRALLIIIIAISLLVALQFISIKILKKLNLQPHRILRIGLFTGSLVILILIFNNPHYYNEHILSYKETNERNWEPLKRAQKEGYIPTLVHTISLVYMDEPEDYTKLNMLSILKKYENLAGTINKNRHKSLGDSQTMLYLSESLMDPGRIPDLLESDTPLKFITKTRKENIGDSMYSQYIGGGTANIEWSVLTSFSLEAFQEPLTITPYSDFYVQAKNHSTILKYFDNEKVALHPYSAQMYKRLTVFELLGFDDFLYLDHGIRHTDKLGTHVRVSDESLNKDIIEVARNRDAGLLHILSMQNHLPYSREIPDMEYNPLFKSDLFPEGREKEVFNYLQGLKASDDAIEDLVIGIEKAEKDVNLLLYGDHFPSIFRGTEDRFQGNELHETPWFLYMNNDRSKKGMDIEGLSPAFLVPVLLREGDYYVSPFHGLLDSLLTKKVKRIGSHYIVTEKGVIEDKEIPKDIMELVKDYRAIQYDALFGENWLRDTFYVPKNESKSS